MRQWGWFFCGRVTKVVNEWLAPKSPLVVSISECGSEISAPFSFDWGGVTFQTNRRCMWTRATFFLPFQSRLFFGRVYTPLVSGRKLLQLCLPMSLANSEILRSRSGGCRRLLLPSQRVWFFGFFVFVGVLFFFWGVGCNVYKYAVGWRFSYFLFASVTFGMVLVQDLADSLFRCFAAFFFFVG